MWISYPFYTDIKEVPYAVWDGNIKYINTEYECGIKIDINFNNDINFKSGVIGIGYDTSSIKDYETLLQFLEEHYNEIEEDDDTSPITRKECIDELIEICKEQCLYGKSN